MRRSVPLLIVSITGFFMLIQYFIPLEESEWLYERILDWIIVIGCFAMLLGLWSLTYVSVNKVKRKVPGWGYNLVALSGLFFMLIVGFVPGQESLVRGSAFMHLFEYVYI
ncbi:MAG: hypothetical protein AMJ90_09990, partial [candidate division Zixibacteria bacterium SM23_73_2]